MHKRRSITSSKIVWSWKWSPNEPHFERFLKKIEETGTVELLMDSINISRSIANTVVDKRENLCFIGELNILFIITMDPRTTIVRQWIKVWCKGRWLQLFHRRGELWNGVFIFYRNGNYDWFWKTINNWKLSRRKEYALIWAYLDVAYVISTIL